MTRKASIVAAVAAKGTKAAIVIVVLGLCVDKIRVARITRFDEIPTGDSEPHDILLGGCRNVAFSVEN